ncbi:MAG TPA: methyltransferase domain-containing protein [Verrucomicrobiota bacterium]|nr:methyltransferase domain-containing protein [Verrucomicrobiota bacterium]
MKRNHAIRLNDVQNVYSGPEGRLWELLMGEQIHIGGLSSSMDLADSARIDMGQCGIDACCASGAGMRFLVRFRGVARMTGVDATHAMVELGRRRCAEEELADRITFVEGDVCDTGLPTGSVDFVWGEDAWCYVEDKSKLIAEAARLVRAGGTIAFTDWMEGAVGLSESEANRYMSFMKFPSVLTATEYEHLLRANGCTIVQCRDTGRFPDHVRLYIDMVEKQLTYDALKIIGFDQDAAEGLIGEMHFLESLAADGKIVQGLIVAQKSLPA